MTLSHRLAIGDLAGGLIAASTARAYAYPAYGYGGYYPASYGYGYGYPAGYGYGYAPTQVVLVRRRVVAPAYYGGYYPAGYAMAAITAGMASVAWVTTVAIIGLGWCTMAAMASVAA